MNAKQLLDAFALAMSVPLAVIGRCSTKSFVIRSRFTLSRRAIVLQNSDQFSGAAMLANGVNSGAVGEAYAPGEAHVKIRTREAAASAGACL